MNPSQIKRSTALALCILAASWMASITAVNAEVVTLEDKKGNSIIVSLVSRQGDKILVKRVKDGKEFAISPNSLNEESKKLILQKASALKEAYPPLEANVSVGKRRKSGRSYYMKSMTITGKVTLTNKAHNQPCPACKGHILFIGQNQSYVDRFILLSNQSFDLTPTTKGSVFKSKPFVTRYDSDNKGVGNIGGYKYIGYLLIVTGEDDQVLISKTNYSKIKKAMELDTGLAKALTSYADNTLLDVAMKKRKARTITPLR